MIGDFLIMVGTAGIIIGLAMVVLIAAKFVANSFDSLDITKSSKPRKKK